MAEIRRVLINGKGKKGARQLWNKNIIRLVSEYEESMKSIKAARLKGPICRSILPFREIIIPVAID
jgi:hypothetical protein